MNFSDNRLWPITYGDQKFEMRQSSYVQSGRSWVTRAVQEEELKWTVFNT